MGKFNSWTIIDDSIPKSTIVRCDCGFEAIRQRGDIISGRSRCCNSCRYKNRKGKGNPKILKHGKSYTKTMTTWSEMKRRCYKEDRIDYKNYGGRGITICDRWLHGDGNKTGFHCFLEDMGDRPDGMTIDRINHDGDYEPSNCRWATNIEQMNNRQDSRFIEYKGERMTMANAARRFNVPYRSIYNRVVLKGMNPEDVIEALV